jgi:hypothetical protein
VRAGPADLLLGLEIEPWVIAEQLRHSDGGALVLELYGHPDRKEAIRRIRRAYSKVTGLWGTGGVRFWVGLCSALPAQPERTQPISGGNRRRQVRPVRTSPKASREPGHLTDAGRRS